MLFNSIEYLLFLFVCVVFYFFLPHRFRWVLLLGASYYFYLTFKVEYVVLLIFSTVLTYFTTIGIGRTENDGLKKVYLLLCVIGNLSVLFYFKYFDFFNQTVSSVFTTVNVNYQPELLNLLLPIGISFYTFQIIGYAMDVYLGVIDPEKHFGKFALFVSFFPQLVSGPIERAGDLLPQIFERKKVDFDMIKGGMKLILWGLFKKLVIADRVSLYTSYIYNNPELYNGPQLLVATYLYGLQMYCDFSGYIDMARGSAMMLGFDLTENFKRPFLSRSMTDFFTRWHITLFRWFNDYVYLPLAVNLRNWRQYGVVAAIFITFLLSGIWHGSTWNFVVWGALLGLCMGVEKITLKARLAIFKHLPNWLVIFLGIFVTFNVVAILNAFFFAHSLSDSIYIATHMFSFDSLANLKSEGGGETGAVPPLYYAILPGIMLVVIEFLQEFFGKKSYYSDSKYAFVRYLSYTAIILLILAIGVFDGGQFIYFQF